jgi:peptidoglycan/xylan/chitin deacetylase (PgdA/CDA1 family)
MKKILMLIFGLLFLWVSACGGPPSVQPTATLPSLPTTASATPELPIASAIPFTPTHINLPTYTPTPSWIHQGPNKATVPILMYHHIGVSPVGSQYYVTPEKFTEQMWLLHAWDYTTITTTMLAEAIREGAELPPRPVLITFDDGNLDNYTKAFPLMQVYGFTGVLYIVGNYIGVDNYLSVAQIKEMAGAGWEIGSHTMNHHDLTKLSDIQKKYEIADSREFLEEKLGMPIATFAYPFGMSDCGIMNMVYSAGYTAAMGLGPTNNQCTEHLFSMYRQGVMGPHDLRKFASFLPWKGDPTFLIAEESELR